MKMEKKNKIENKNKIKFIVFDSDITSLSRFLLQRN